MTPSVERWQALGVHPPLDALRRRKLEATQALLGDTITLSDEMWRGPSLLPGWSRAHVAAHLARNADDLRALVQAAAQTAQAPDAGVPDRYALVVEGTPSTPAERRAAVEQGARRTGLDLQIDLDTSAGLLSAAFDDIEATGTQQPVRLGERLVVPAPIVALARLSEVVLHHADLGIDTGIRTAAEGDAGTGDEPADGSTPASGGEVGAEDHHAVAAPTPATSRRLARLEPDTAHWLVAWELFRGQYDTRLPTMLVHTDSGLTAMVGALHLPPVAEVRGSDADLVRWLSGRGDASGLWSSAPVAAQLPPH